MWFGLTRLRAADALYVWRTARDGLPLVTANQEDCHPAPLARATAVIP
jgi:predicted nucleic acid-binding protein